MSVQLYQGDCLTFMRTLADKSIDCVLTDPPYPELKGGQVISLPGSGVAGVRNITKTVGTPWETSLDWMDEAWRVCRFGMLVFCSFHSVDIVKEKFRDNAVCLSTWHKRNSAPSICNAPHFTTEFIWAFKKSPGLKWRALETFYDIPGLPGGCMGNERIKNADGSTAHPTQKPSLLLRKLLRIDPGSVLDPFMGTGTTGEACMQTGRDFIGCEKDPAYFAIAKRRIELAQAQPLLFADEPNQPDDAPRQASILSAEQIRYVEESP